MIIPVRCFSCGKVIGSLYAEYQRMVQQEKKDPKEAMDALGLKRYCCRRMVLSHVDLIDDVLPFG